MHNYYKYLFLCLSILFCSCKQGKTQIYAKSLPVAVDTVSNSILGEPKNGVIVINDSIDLKNRICVLQPGLKLLFKGGVIKNGTLKGNGTRLESDTPCFDRLTILGTWDVPTIKSSLFCDLSYDNALKDVVALSNPEIRNKIIIEKGNYQVSATKGCDACLIVNSNTDIILKGTITLVPNDYSNYDIIKTEGSNIIIRGGGCIVGDKHSHTGKTGEWGMGLSILASENVQVSEINIKECWGDCLYIGDNSENIFIRNCTFTEGRRQGISITSGKRIRIINCEIKKVYGTPPQFAIDIEPNENDSIQDVYVKVRTDGCIGGLKINGNANNSIVDNITFDRCVIKDTKNRYPVYLDNATNVSVNQCVIDTGNKVAFFAGNISDFRMKGYKCVSNNNPEIIIKNCSGEY